MASRDYGEILGWSRESDGVYCIEEEETTGKLEKNGKNNWRGKNDWQIYPTKPIVNWNKKILVRWLF